MLGNYPIDRISPNEHAAFQQWIRGGNDWFSTTNSSKVSESIGQYSFNGNLVGSEIPQTDEPNEDCVGLVCRDGDIWQAGAFCTFHTGKFAVLSVRIEVGRDQAAIEIIEAMVHLARTRQVELLQFILNEEETDDTATTARVRSCLGQAGLKPLTQLWRMNLDFMIVGLKKSVALVELSDKTSNFGEVVFRSAARDELAMLSTLTEKTYRGTLDCSELDGVRSTEETLIGYRDASQSQQRDWWIASIGTDDVGCVFLSEIGFDVWELTYMGVFPEFRGRGVGSALLQHAISECSAKHAQHLTLAVDERNAPAIELYRRHGFTVLGSIQAWYWHPGLQEKSLPISRLKK